MATPEPKSEHETEELIKEISLPEGYVKVAEVSRSYAQLELGEGFFGIWDDESIVRGEE
jgi:hypothetical protein